MKVYHLALGIFAVAAGAFAAGRSTAPAPDCHAEVAAARTSALGALADIARDVTRADCAAACRAECAPLTARWDDAVAACAPLWAVASWPKDGKISKAPR